MYVRRRKGAKKKCVSSPELNLIRVSWASREPQEKKRESTRKMGGGKEDPL